MNYFQNVYKILIPHPIVQIALQQAPWIKQPIADYGNMLPDIKKAWNPTMLNDYENASFASKHRLYDGSISTPDVCHGWNMLRQIAYGPTFSLTMKVVPLPGSLFTDMEPPASSMTRSESARPRPLPSREREVSP